ncbi:MAG: hypothetical protein ABI861_14240, partial [Panacibacter sp.]
MFCKTLILFSTSSTLHNIITKKITSFINLFHFHSVVIPVGFNRLPAYNYNCQDIEKFYPITFYSQQKMQPMYFTRGLLPAIALLCLTITSCKKNETPATTPAQTTTQSLLMTATNDIVSGGNLESQDVADVIGSDVMGTGDSSTCRTVTFSPSRKVYPYEKTIDFGSGCTGLDGHTRAGKKIITIYANPDSSAAGTMISETTFRNFSYDGIMITGDVKSYV